MEYCISSYVCVNVNGDKNTCKIKPTFVPVDLDATGVSECVKIKFQKFMQEFSVGKARISHMERYS